MHEQRPFSYHLKTHLALGLPLIGSHLAQTAIGITDTVMLGWYDVEALAALVLANTFYIALFLFGSGFAFAVMPLVAAAAEQGDETRVRRVTRMGLWISFGVGAMALPLLLFSDPLLRALGQDPELSAVVQGYMRIMGWGIFPALAVMVLKSYLSALERTIVQLVVTIGAALANAALNYVLIFGRFGAPEMGIHGAAVASLGVQVISVVALVLYAVRAFPSHALFRRVWKPDVAAIREVFGMGWHIAVAVLAEVGLFSCSSLLVGTLGTVPLAAHGIALQLSGLSFMVPLGLSNAATVRAGRAYGRGDAQALRTGAKAAQTLGLAWGLFAVVVFVSAAEFLVGLFIDPTDPLRGEIQQAGRVLIYMSALFQLADFSQAIAAALLRGMQDTRRPMLLATASYWLVGAPASWLFGIVLGYGAPGVWIGLVAGLSTASVLLNRRFWTLLAELSGHTPRGG